MTDRRLPGERGVSRRGPGRAGPRRPRSGSPPARARGSRTRPRRSRIGPRTLAWGERTFVMGILNVTPDSFSGDGLLAGRDPSRRPSTWPAAWSRRAPTCSTSAARRAGRATRPGAGRGGGAGRAGHPCRRRGAPRDAALGRHDEPAVAAAALDAGAHLLNDIWGVAGRPAWPASPAERGVPIVLMHNRAEARYRNLVAEIVADLQRAIDRALAAGVPWEHLVVDPGFGFGKTPDHNLALLGDLAAIGCSAVRCSSGRRASPPWAGCSTCRPTSASRRRPRPRRSRSRRASTWCASTTSARTSGSRA